MHIHWAGIATVVVALGFATACASEDATGPNISLSREEVLALAGELGYAMSVIAIPNLGDDSLHGSASCPDGGSASVTGGYGAATAPTGDSVAFTAAATVTWNGCKTVRYQTDGPLDLTGSGTVTSSSTVAHAIAKGALTVMTSDGRSGACDIDVAVSYTASGVMREYLVTGSACGVDVAGRYH